MHDGWSEGIPTLAGRAGEGGLSTRARQLSLQGLYGPDVDSLHRTTATLSIHAEPPSGRPVLLPFPPPATPSPAWPAARKLGLFFHGSSVDAALGYSGTMPSETAASAWTSVERCTKTMTTP